MGAWDTRDGDGVWGDVDEEAMEGGEEGEATDRRE
jgi:hypothetical protein